MDSCQEPRYLIASAAIDGLTLDEIRAELEWLVEQRFMWSYLGSEFDKRYRLLADRERCLLEQAS